MVFELWSPKPFILFRKVTAIKTASLVAFYDASHSGKREVYGQSRILKGMKLEQHNSTVCQLVARAPTNKKTATDRKGLRFWR